MASAASKAVKWAVSIAEDDSHGYDQGSRWGADYDCSSLVIQAYENAGVPVKTNGATYTGNMVSVFISCGFIDITSQVNLQTGSGMIAGDVVWKTSHVEMVSSPGFLVGATSNENGGATGGAIGDQTGEEIAVRAYYNSPWEKVLRYVGDGSAPTTPISGNRFLSMSEMQNNAIYIYWYLIRQGWTINAIAGLLGNMQTESTINPGIWENLDDTQPDTLGRGLVGWTPASRVNAWAEERDLDPAAMDTQLKMLLWEVDNGGVYYTTSAYPTPETFKAFTQSTESPYYLGMAFLYNYERPYVQDQPARGEQAEYWYEYLSGIDIDPTPGKTSRRRKGYNFLLFGKKTWRSTI